MNEYERWADLEGPEPPGIKELMDAGRDVPDLTPEQEARLDRALFERIAARRRAAEQERKKRARARWLMASGVAAALAAAAVLAFVIAESAPHVKLPLSATRAEPIPAGPPDAGRPASTGTPRRGGRR